MSIKHHSLCFETQSSKLADFDEDEVVRYACIVLEKRMSYKKLGPIFTSPGETRQYLTLKLSEQEREVFAVLFLDNRHRLILYEELFFGTIDGASVYPREVVKAALRHNAAAAILAHNHPSGVAEPSKADKAITERLKNALALIDVRTLDHLIVAGNDVVSFAERGLI